MSQGALFGVTVPPGLKLGSRQMFALESLGAGPLSSEQLGVAIHARRRCDYCKPDRPCQFVQTEGAEVGASLRRHGLARFSRKRGVWYLVETGLPPDQTAQGRQIPF
jgi:hypothetical protein